MNAVMNAMMNAGWMMKNLKKKKKRENEKRVTKAKGGER